MTLFRGGQSYPNRGLGAETLDTLPIAPVGPLGTAMADRADLTRAALPSTRTAIEPVALHIDAAVGAAFPACGARPALLRKWYAERSALLVATRALAYAERAAGMPATFAIGVAVVQRPRRGACRCRPRDPDCAGECQSDTGLEKIASCAEPRKRSRELIELPSIHRFHSPESSQPGVSD